ncbi:TPA: hypothetical protein HA251_08855 [Candidatus Woesearchaeota archaeon]|nr:hypothetical protein [Candidatus Woesearchaeota archaeon]
MRRAQAAMEFLTTYGWAMLVILLAAGALAYFGVLAPKTVMPDACDAGIPFACFEYAAYPDGVALSLRYGGVDSLDRVNVTIDGCGSVERVVPVQTSDVILAYVACPRSGERQKMTFTVRYHEPEDALDQTVVGRVVVWASQSDRIESDGIFICRGDRCS